VNSNRLASALDFLFPFSFEFGSDLRLINTGHGFDDRFPTMHVGAALSDVAKVMRPVLHWDFTVLTNATDRLVVIEILESPVRFTGQFVTIDGRDSCYFLGGPWVSTLEVMTASRLQLSDFPPHDPRGDLLLQAQAREAMLSDLAETNRRMKQAEAEARVLQEHAERRQRMDVAAQVSGGLAHNFNNLLALMEGHVELAQISARQGDLEAVSQRLEQVRAATTDAADLIRQIQNLSVDRAVEIERVDLVEVLGRAQRLVQPALGTEVSWSIPAPGPIWIFCDPRALQEILINLALNAAEAMQKKGDITCEISEDANLEPALLGILAGDKRWVCLTFTDSGPGFSDQALDRAFEPFFSTKSEQHSGLGLATVERLVALNGGAVRLGTTSGRGAVFRIWFEAAQG